MAKRCAVFLSRLAQYRTPRITTDIFFASQASIELLWKRAREPSGDARRKGLPDRCDGEWFSRTFCGGVSLERVGPDNIWPHVKSFNFYGPLAMLAAVPTCMKRFFKPEAKRTPDGVEHLVIGASSEPGHDGIRDSVALRTFLLDAFKYSLATSMKKYRRRRSVIATSAP
jgi:hypothetical protein